MKRRIWGILTFLIIFFGITSCDVPVTVQEAEPLNMEQQAGIDSAELLFRLFRPKCENGVLSSGALYEICVPRPWNRELVVYAPGYRDPNLDLRIRDDEIGGFSVQEIMNNLGYAFATTSYHKNGLSLPEALEDVTELVELTDKFTRPPLRNAYLTGPSFGGLVTVLGIEQYANTFSAALGACGPYGDFAWQLKYLGDFRVVFDHLFVDEIVEWPVWTMPGTVDADFIAQWGVFEPAIRAAILADWNAGGEKVKQLLRITGAPVDLSDPQTTVETSVETVVDVLWYHVHGTNDAMEIMEGQPYHNIGQNFDNLDVKRFTANVSVKDHYQTSGSLQRPLVTLHTHLDPVIPIQHLAFYNGKVNPKTLHTPIPVLRYGHCNFTIEEVMAAFALMIFKSTNQDLLVSTSVFPEPVQQQSFLTIARELGAYPKIVTPLELKKTMEPYERVK